MGVSLLCLVRQEELGYGKCGEVRIHQQIHSGYISVGGRDHTKMSKVVVFPVRFFMKILTLPISSTTHFTALKLCLYAKRIAIKMSSLLRETKRTITCYTKHIVVPNCYLNSSPKIKIHIEIQNVLGYRSVAVLALEITYKHLWKQENKSVGTTCTGLVFQPKRWFRWGRILGIHLPNK